MNQLRGERVTPAAYWLLAVLTALYVVSMIDRQVIGTLIPSMKADLDLTDVQLSLITGAAFAAFYCIMGLPFGYAVDRWSRRLVIGIGLSVWGIATIGCGLAGSFTQLIVARFMVGAGEAALSPAAYSLFGDSFPRHRLTLATSVFGCGAVAGTSLSYVFGGQLLAALPPDGISSPFGWLMPWQAVFIFAALPALTLLPLLFLIREPKRREQSVPTKAGPREAMRFLRTHKGFFLRFFIGYGIMAGGCYAFSIWGPTALVRRFDMPISEVSITFGLISLLAVTASTLGLGLATDRLIGRGITDAPMRVYSLSGLGLVGFGCLLALAPTYTVALIAVFGLFFCSGMAGMGATIPLTVPSHLRGQVAAVFLLVGNMLGIGVGPSLPALFTDHIFEDPAFTTWSIALALLLCGTISFLLLFTARAPMRRVVDEVTAEA